MGRFQKQGSIISNIMKGIVAFVLFCFLNLQMQQFLYVSSWKIRHGNRSQSAPKIKKLSKKTSSPRK